MLLGGVHKQTAEARAGPKRARRRCK